MSVRRLLLVAVACCASVCGAQEQNIIPPKFWLGGGVGYGFGMFSLSGPGTACNFDPACPQYTGGTGGGVLAGISADWHTSKSFGLLLRASYFGSAVTMKTTVSDALVRDAGGNVVPLVRTHSLDVHVPEITIDLFPEWRTGMWRVFAGPTASFIMSPTWSSTASIASPNNVTYANNLRDTVLLPQQPLSDVRSTIFNLTVGAGVDIPLSTHLNLSPELSFTFPLQTLRTNSDWKESSLRLLVNVRYGFGGGCEARDVRDFEQHIDTLHLLRTGSTSVDVIPGLPTITTEEHTEDCVHHITRVMWRTDTMLAPCVTHVALAVSAVDRDGSRHSVSRVTEKARFVTEVFPILPTVFFSDGSATMLPQYRTLRMTEGFDIDSLEPNALALHYDVLNIIGDRMMRAPDARISVRGYADPVSEHGDCNLARQRGEEIKSYLSRMWGIDGSRVTVVTGTAPCVDENVTQSQTPEGHADNRYATITSDDSTILAPVVRRHFVDPGPITPSALAFDPEGTVPCGATSYTMMATQGKRVVFAQTEKGNPKPATHVMTPADGRALTAGPLRCTLAVKDTLGQTTYSEPVNLDVRKDTSASELRRLSLTLFAVGKDNLSDADKKAIADFVREGNSDAAISITGYTDNIGDKTFNTELSQRRARNVAEFIKSINPGANIVRTEGVGERQFPPGIISYATPQERHLSRTVQVEISAK